MGKSVYSFQGSKVHLKMNDELANGYNRAVDAWLRAQRDFELVHGRKITPQEIMDGKMHICAVEADVEAYNTVVRFMNKLYDDGLELKMEDCPSNYLEKIS